MFLTDEVSTIRSLIIPFLRVEKTADKGWLLCERGLLVVAGKGFHIYICMYMFIYIYIYINVYSAQRRRGEGTVVLRVVSFVQMSLNQVIQEQPTPRHTQ